MKIGNSELKNQATSEFILMIWKAEITWIESSWIFVEKICDEWLAER